MSNANNQKGRLLAMQSASILTAIMLFLRACHLEQPAQAREPENIVPVRVEDPQIQHSLQGWKKSPSAHASNRIVFKSRGYSDARALTVENSTLSFQRAVNEAMAKEGITKVRVLAQRDVQGAIAHDFRIVTGIRRATFRS